MYHAFLAAFEINNYQPLALPESVIAWQWQLIDSEKNWIYTRNKMRYKEMPKDYQVSMQVDYSETTNGIVNDKSTWSNSLFNCKRALKSMQ